MRQHSGVRILPLFLSAIVAGAFLAVTASAQGVVPDRITSTLSLQRGDYPLTVTHVYELGRVQATYYADGSYTEQPARGLGKLLDMVVFGATISHGTIDNETTPGTGRKALVSFTSVKEADGSTTTIIVIDDVAT